MPENKTGKLLYLIVELSSSSNLQISSHLLLDHSAIRHGALTINMDPEESKPRKIKLSRTSWLKRSLNMLCQNLPSRTNSKLRRNRILQHLENDNAESRLAHYASQKYEFFELPGHPQNIKHHRPLWVSTLPLIGSFSLLPVRTSNQSFRGLPMIPQL